MQAKSISKGIAEVVDIVATANGTMVGRTRLQKTACLLTIAGLSDSFSFVYKHYGPYSQELADAIELASLFDDLKEELRGAQWGGTYSVFSTEAQSRTTGDSARARIIEIANAANPIELELATTAVFLAKQGVHSAWEETARRKPDKIGNGHLNGAKVLYAKLCDIRTPTAFPKF